MVGCCNAMAVTCATWMYLMALTAKAFTAQAQEISTNATTIIIPNSNWLTVLL